jgi:hypothetical protein
LYNKTVSDPDVSDYDGMDDDFFGDANDDLQKDEYDKLVKEFKDPNSLVRDTEVEMTEKFLNLAGDMVIQMRFFKSLLRSVNPFVLLGAYKPLEPRFFNAAPNGHPLYSYPNMGLINDDSYCEFVDLYNLYHPENIFKSMNFFSDYHPEGKRSQIKYER